MHRRLLTTLTLAATAALAPVAAADAAKKPAPYPTIATIAPMQISVGDTVTITGKNFVRGKRKNTVVFRRDGNRAVFAKADGVSATRLNVKVPSQLTAQLAQKAGVAVPTRFRIRILSRRFGRAYTTLAKSPVVLPVVPKLDVPAEQKAAEQAAALAALAARVNDPAPPPPAPDCDGDGTPDSADADDDNDLLLDTTENAILTNRCLTDTDGDAMQDGWEYKSAVDLNTRSCPTATGDYPTPCAPAFPYPGKRPYPNALDGSDAAVDHDGDWLSNGQEHQAWFVKGSRSITNPWYSGGLQASQDTSSAAGCRGMAVPQPFDGDGVRYEFRDEAGNYPDVTQPEYAVYTLDNFGRVAGDGCLSDGERDEDGDFLNNVTETSGPLSDREFFKKIYSGEVLYRVVYSATDWLDRDSDGDTIGDGLDDQDNDDFLNVEEAFRGAPARDKDNKDTARRDGLWVDAFNPCLPAIRSRTCPPAEESTGDVWTPFTPDGSETPPVPRWPLYGTPLYNPVDEPTPDPDPNVPNDTTSAESWDGLPPNEQVLPPLHPLPRP